MVKIILATASPYRQEAFKFLGLDFIAEASKVDEYTDSRPKDPDDLVKYLAKLKAGAVAKNHSEGIVVGFDSIGYFEDSILEKPKSREEGFARLQMISGKNFQFCTGVHVINVPDGQTFSRVVKTEVSMRELSDNEINKYLDQDPNFNTYALGFDPLGHYSSTFISNIEGSYNNLLRGIPLEVIVEMLSSAGIKV